MDMLHVPGVRIHAICIKPVGLGITEGLLRTGSALNLPKILFFNSALVNGYILVVLVNVFYIYVQ